MALLGTAEFQRAFLSRDCFIRYLSARQMPGCIPKDVGNPVVWISGSNVHRQY